MFYPTQVTQALVPTAAFAGSPDSAKASKHSSSQLRMAPAASSSKQPRQAAFGPPQPGILGRQDLSDEFSEPESSLFDYQLMDEAG